MYACMRARIYAGMIACMCGGIETCVQVYTHVCMHVWRSRDMCAGIHMYACMCGGVEIDACDGCMCGGLEIDRCLCGGVEIDACVEV